MQPSAEFFILLAALAAGWLSIRSSIRTLTEELRAINGDPALRDRDIEFNEALDRVSKVLNEPIGPRETLEAHHGRSSA